MSPASLLLLALVTAAPAKHAKPTTGTVSAHCMNDRPRNTTEVQARNAWAQRCAPQAATSWQASYPVGSFASFLGQSSPFAAEAACDAATGQPVRCHAEGLLAGQRVLTDAGYVDVASLEARGVTSVACWDSTAPQLTGLPMVGLQAVVRRPYRGPVILIETDLGALLDVTAGQPVLLRNGTVVRADALAVGDVLLGFDGMHHVERVAQVHRDTYAYQIYVDRGDFDHNVVFTEDLFVGSARLATHRQPQG